MIALRLCTIEPEERIIKVWFACSMFAKVKVRKPGQRIGLACLSAGFRGLAYEVVDWEFVELETLFKKHVKKIRE